MFTALYASPITSIRQKLWEALQEISMINNFSWFLAGDFIDIDNCNEKFGGVNLNVPLDRGINGMERDCCLIDLGYVGPMFTWSNVRVGSNLIEKD